MHQKCFIAGLAVLAIAVNAKHNFTRFELPAPSDSHWNVPTSAGANMLSVAFNGAHITVDTFTVLAITPGLVERVAVERPSTGNRIDHALQVNVNVSRNSLMSQVFQSTPNAKYSFALYSVVQSMRCAHKIMTRSREYTAVHLQSLASNGQVSPQRTYSREPPPVPPRVGRPPLYTAAEEQMRALVPQNDAVGELSPTSRNMFFNTLVSGRQDMLGGGGMSEGTEQLTEQFYQRRQEVRRRGEQQRGAQQRAEPEPQEPQFDNHGVPMSPRSIESGRRMREAAFNDWRADMMRTRASPETEALGAEHTAHRADAHHRYRQQNGGRLPNERRAPSHIRAMQGGVDDITREL